MNYIDEWFYVTKSRLTKLDRYYALSLNLYDQFQRLLLKYHFIYSNIKLMLICDYFKQIIISMYSKIPDLKRNLFSSKLSNNIKKKLSEKLNKFSEKYVQIIKERGNNITSNNSFKTINYQTAWESIFIQKMTKMFKMLYRLNPSNQRDMIKQCNQIIRIYLFLNKRLHLILNNPRFYQLIDVSIRRVELLREQSTLLPLKYRKKIKSALKRYLKSIQSWKLSLYQYIWFSKQIPILKEHQQIVVEFLFPKITF